MEMPQDLEYMEKVLTISLTNCLQKNVSLEKWVKTEKIE